MSQRFINPAGQESEASYKQRLHEEPILWPAEGERVQRAVEKAVVDSLTQALTGDDRRDKTIMLVTSAVRAALVPLTRAGG